VVLAVQDDTPRFASQNTIDRSKKVFSHRPNIPSVKKPRFHWIRRAGSLLTREENQKKRNEGEGIDTIFPPFRTRTTPPVTVPTSRLQIFPLSSSSSTAAANKTPHVTSRPSSSYTPNSYALQSHPLLPTLIKMPPTTTPTSPPANGLPPLSVRNDIAAKLDDLIGALATHPLMQRQDRHKTVLHTWYVLLHLCFGKRDGHHHDSVHLGKSHQSS
jgi:hypothetical protein